MNSIVGVVTLIQAVYSMIRYIRTHPGVWRYIIIAVILNIFSLITAILVVFYCLTWLLGQGAGLMGAGGNSIIDSLIAMTGLFAALLLGWAGFSLLSPIANAAVYSSMVDTIVQDDLGLIDASVRIPLYKALGLTIIHESKKLCIVLPLTILTILLNFIPFIGSFASFALFTIQIMVVAGLDMYEPIMIYKDVRFRYKLKFLWENRSMYASLLLVAGFLFALPVINILMIPFVYITGFFFYSRMPLLPTVIVKSG